MKSMKCEREFLKKKKRKKTNAEIEEEKLPDRRMCEGSRYPWQESRRPSAATPSLLRLRLENPRSDEEALVLLSLCRGSENLAEAKIEEIAHVFTVIRGRGRKTTNAPEFLVGGRQLAIYKGRGVGKFRHGCNLF